MTRNAEKQRTALLTLLLLLLGAFLRIHAITEQSIWFDEAFAWNIIIQDDMYPRISTDTHPPLYYLLLRGWSELTGDSALALRYLSALISLMTVACVYQVARELVRKRPALAGAPVLAALLLALTDAEIFLAQEARNYALYSFFATVSMWLYLRWLRKPSGAAALGWAASVAALVYTHYHGVFIPAIQGLHLLVFLRGRKRLAGIATLSLSGMLVLPWFLGVTVPQAKNAIQNDLPFAISSDWEMFLHLRDNYLGAQWALLLALAVVGLASLVSAPRQDTPCRAPAEQTNSSNEHDERHVRQPYHLDIGRYGEFFLVFMWFALPFGVLWVGNYFMALLTERKLLIVAPAIALMVAFGLGRLRNPARLLLVLAIVIYGLSSTDYYRVKEPWDRIAAYALAYAQPSDLALVEAGVGQYPMKYYWERLLPDGAVFSTRSVLGDGTISPTDDWYTYYNALLPELMADSQTAQVGEVATAWLVWWGGHEMMLASLADNGYVRTMTVPFDHLGNAIQLFRYDHLPESPCAEYANGMTLRAVEIDAGALRVDLWWSALEATPPPGYVTMTSAMLLDENGAPAGQRDSPPFFGQRPVETWGSGEVVFDPKYIEPMEGRDAIPPGTYTVIVKVYWWSPGGLVDVATTAGDPWVEVGRLRYNPTN